MKPTGFVWDSGNKEKNWKRHGVTEKECEEIFSDPFVQIAEDPKHSVYEYRFSALGKTEKGRRIVVFFTIRAGLIRVISARDQSRKERRTYESKEKSN